MKLSGVWGGGFITGLVGFLCMSQLFSQGVKLSVQDNFPPQTSKLPTSNIKLVYWHTN